MASEPRKYARTAQSHFAQAEKREELWKQEREKTRIADEAKTARLRALRLAKEAEELEKPK
jgi:hypothetical protein